MAVSTFGATGGAGSNDLGGEVIGSAVISTRGTFPVALTAGVRYVISAVGTSSSGISIRYSLAGVDSPLAEFSLTAGEGSVSVLMPGNADALFVSGLQGALAVRKWETTATSFSYVPAVEQIMRTSLNGSSSDPRNYIVKNDKHFFMTKQSQSVVYKQSVAGGAWSLAFASSDNTPWAVPHNSFVFAASNTTVITSNSQYGGTGLYRFTWDATLQNYKYVANTGQIFSGSGANSIAYIPEVNRFVAICSGDQWAYRSDNDGASWVGSNIGTTNNYTGLYYVGGVLFALSSNTTATYHTSSDYGVTWVSRSFPLSSVWIAPAFLNGVFVATYANNTSTTVYTSTDGFAWTSRTYPAFTTGTLNPVVASGQFVLMRRGAQSGQIRAAYSTDGITWNTSPYDYFRNYHYTEYTVAYHSAVEYQGDVLAFPTETAIPVARWRNSDKQVVWAGIPYLVYSQYNGRNISISPDGQKIWASATSNYWHFYSIDGGVTWVGYPSYLYNGSAFGWIGDSAVVFNNQIGSAYRFNPINETGSVNVTSISANQYIEHVAINGNAIWASSGSPSGNSVRSSDGGATWVQNSFAGWRFPTPIKNKPGNFIIGDASNFYQEVNISTGSLGYPAGITTNRSVKNGGFFTDGSINVYWTTQTGTGNVAQVVFDVFQNGVFQGERTVSTGLLAGISNTYGTLWGYKGALFAMFIDPSSGLFRNELLISYDNGVTWQQVSLPSYQSNLRGPLYFVTGYAQNDTQINAADQGFQLYRNVGYYSSSDNYSVVKWRTLLA